MHGVVRTTGDLDIWVRPMGLTLQDLSELGTVYQIGLPPKRIDILTEISGVEFDEAWDSRVVQEAGGLTVPFLGRHALLRNKKASGRTKDLADIEMLEKPTSQ